MEYTIYKLEFLMVHTLEIILWKVRNVLFRQIHYSLHYV